MHYVCLQSRKLLFLSVFQLTAASLYFSLHNTLVTAVPLVETLTDTNKMIAVIKSLKSLIHRHSVLTALVLMDSPHQITSGHTVRYFSSKPLNSLDRSILDTSIAFQTHLRTSLLLNSDSTGSTPYNNRCHWLRCCQAPRTCGIFAHLDISSCPIEYSSHSFVLTIVNPKVI